MREFALLARLAPHLKGAGDDAAVLEAGGVRLAVAVDALVEGRHFRWDLSRPADVGWKAIAVNASDLAAMGAVRPRAALVALLLPPGTPVGEVEELYEGMSAAAAHSGLDLVGGDTSAAPVLSLAVTVIGELERDPVWRSGARPGDHLVVVGALGAAAAALAEADAGRVPAPALLAAHRRPRALAAAGRVLAEHGATALIDVSDGLGQDLGHLCAASGVAARVRWPDLPVADGVVAAAKGLGLDPVELVCGGGEDYALLAALPAARAAEAAEAAKAAEGVAAEVVGQVVPIGDAAGRLVGLETGDGVVRDIGDLGWDHFRSDQERQ